MQSMTHTVSYAGFNLDLSVFFAYSATRYIIDIFPRVQCIHSCFNSTCSHLSLFLTGPLLHENLDVQNIPLQHSRDLSVHLCGKDIRCVSSYNGDITCIVIVK